MKFRILSFDTQIFIHLFSFQAFLQLALELAKKLAMQVGKQ